jgi:hypothetical protein
MYPAHFPEVIKKAPVPFSAHLWKKVTVPFLFIAEGIDGIGNGCFYGLITHCEDSDSDRNYPR